MLGQTGSMVSTAGRKSWHLLGYLHNHARMWFASIWIFTLRLPGAWGFFLRHLIDGNLGLQHSQLALGCGPSHTRQDLPCNCRQLRRTPTSASAPQVSHQRPAPCRCRQYSCPASRPRRRTSTQRHPASSFSLKKTCRPGIPAGPVPAPEGHRRPDRAPAVRPLPVAAPVHRFTADAVSDALARRSPRRPPLSPCRPARSFWTSPAHRALRRSAHPSPRPAPSPARWRIRPPCRAKGHHPDPSPARP